MPESTENTTTSTNPLTKIPMELVPEEWKDNVRDLRRENQSLRERTKSADETLRSELEKALTAERAKHDEVLTKERGAAQSRILTAELKVAAKAAGMVDLDGLKLADLSTVKLNAETGEVEGAEALMEALKKSKPYLFSNGSTTTSTDPKPKPKADEPVDVTKMSAEEYAKHKQALIRKSR